MLTAIQRRAGTFVLALVAVLGIPAVAQADGQGGYYFTWGHDGYDLGDCADANQTGSKVVTVCFKEAGDHMIVRNRIGAPGDQKYVAAAVWKNLATGRKGICGALTAWTTRDCNYQMYEGANISLRAAFCDLSDDCTNINNYIWESDWITRRNDN